MSAQKGVILLRLPATTKYHKQTCGEEPVWEYFDGVDFPPEKVSLEGQSEVGHLRPGLEHDVDCRCPILILIGDDVTAFEAKAAGVEGRVVLFHRLHHSVSVDLCVIHKAQGLFYYFFRLYFGHSFFLKNSA